MDGASPVLKEVRKRSKILKNELWKKRLKKFVLKAEKKY